MFRELRRKKKAISLEAASGKAVQLFEIEIEHISGKQIQEI